MSDQHRTQHQSSDVRLRTANDIEAPLYGSDAGSTDTYVCSLSPAIGAYKTGAHYRFKANTANTGACTINFNSLGAKTIKKAVGGITTDLDTNDIRVGQWVDLVYDGTNMQMQSTLGNSGAGYTDEQAQDAVGTILTDTATIDFTYTDATPEITADVKSDSITYAKLQNVSATDRVLGRSTAGAGDVEEIALTAAGRALIDDADAAAQRATLGLAIGWDVQPYDAGLGSNIAVRVRKSTDTSLTEDTFTTITFDTEIFDDYAMHSTVSNTSRLTAVRAGKHAVHGLASFDSSAVGIRLIRIIKNANTALVVDWQQLNACAAGYTRVSAGGALVHLDAGDYIELQAYFYFTGSGGTLALKADGTFSPSLSMFWVCP